MFVITISFIVCCFIIFIFSIRIRLHLAKYIEVVYLIVHLKSNLNRVCFPSTKIRVNCYKKCEFKNTYFSTYLRHLNPSVYASSHIYLYYTMLAFLHLRDFLELLRFLEYPMYIKFVERIS